MTNTIDFETKARERKVEALTAVLTRLLARGKVSLYSIQHMNDFAWQLTTDIANEDAKKEAERTGEKFVEMHMPSATTRRLVIDALKRSQS